MAVTGATGYVGSRIVQRLRADGWQVVRLSHTAAPTDDVISFRLGDRIEPSVLAAFSALVHCAYDFGPVESGKVQEVNIVGSERLLRAAQEVGVGSTIVISSISAFRGCRSIYGQAKLQVEDAARAMGAFVIRPGLVWGERPGGLFGHLLRMVGTSPVLPFPAGGRRVQYLVSDLDVSEAVCRCLNRSLESDIGPITVAHPHPWPLKELLAEMARAQGRRPILLPVPWQAIWLPLRMGDGLRLPLPFHSDSLISFVHQNENPTFNAFDTIGLRCREFRIDGGDIHVFPRRRAQSDQLTQRVR